MANIKIISPLQEIKEDKKNIEEILKKEIESFIEKHGSIELHFDISYNFEKKKDNSESLVALIVESEMKIK